MANIARRNPFEDMFEELKRGFSVRPFSATDDELTLKIDVKEDDTGYAVRAEIPGVRKDDIQVDINGNQVSVRAEVKKEKEEKKGERLVYSECSYGAVSRSFTLPMDIDANAASAAYKDGVLNLRLPKKAGGSSSRISVN